MITYKTKVEVFLNGKKVGEIREIKPAASTWDQAFTYFPKGCSKHGNVYSTIEQVKFWIEKE